MDSQPSAEFPTIILGEDFRQLLIPWLVDTVQYVSHPRQEASVFECRECGREIEVTEVWCGACKAEAKDACLMATLEENRKLKDELAAARRSCPDHDHLPALGIETKGYPCAYCLEKAWKERDEATTLADDRMSQIIHLKVDLARAREDGAQEERERIIAEVCRPGHMHQVVIPRPYGAPYFDEARLRAALDPTEEDSHG